MPKTSPPTPLRKAERGDEPLPAPLSPRERGRGRGGPHQFKACPPKPLPKDAE